MSKRNLILSPQNAFSDGQNESSELSLRCQPYVGHDGGYDLSTWCHSVLVMVEDLISHHGDDLTHTMMVAQIICLGMLI